MFDGAQAFSECHMLVVGQFWSTKYQHRMLIHAGVNGRRVVRAQRPAKINARDFARKAAADLFDAKGHVPGFPYDGEAESLEAIARLRKVGPTVLGSWGTKNLEERRNVHCPERYSRD